MLKQCLTTTAALTLAGCASTPDVEFHYFPARATTALTVTQTIDCTPDKQALNIVHTPTVVTSYASNRAAFEEINLRKRPVRARTAAQDAYIRALKRYSLVFGTGPAGTGKTWLAVAQAIQMFERKEVDRIILSRPAVEAGERLGFLPGDMREKVDPYLRPIYDALYDLMDARIVERALEGGEIEIAPLAFMRGRTLSNACVILDEAQNTTSMQMKMFLTRLGENSRMIVTGDPSQVDLPNGQPSGLAEAVQLLDGIEGIGHVAFSAQDVIRHELVGRIVEAYDRATPARGSKK